MNVEEFREKLRLLISGEITEDEVLSILSELEEDKLNPKKPVKKEKVKKVKSTSKPSVETPLQQPMQNINTLPPSMIMQQNYKPTPYLKSKPIIHDEDFTINDY